MNDFWCALTGVGTSGGCCGCGCAILMLAVIGAGTLFVFCLVASVFR